MALQVDASLANGDSLADIQDSRDMRGIAIDQVGVRKLKYPVSIPLRDGGSNQGAGEFTLTIKLPQELKGTHMSRFIEVLEEQGKELNPTSVQQIVSKLRERLDSSAAFLSANFTLFLERKAPVTGKTALMGYVCGWNATSGELNTLEYLVDVPVATLCPCSKEISAYGAHNQRGMVRARVEVVDTGAALWFEDLIEAIEASASSPLYPLLKRPDEKFVTERAYETPRFVEDLIREVAGRFDKDRRIASYDLEVENFESIHDHNAYATLKKVKSL